MRRHGERKVWERPPAGHTFRSVLNLEGASGVWPRPGELRCLSLRSRAECRRGWPDLPVQPGECPWPAAAAAAAAPAPVAQRPGPRLGSPV